MTALRFDPDEIARATGHSEEIPPVLAPARYPLVTVADPDDPPIPDEPIAGTRPPDPGANGNSPHAAPARRVRRAQTSERTPLTDLSNAQRFVDRHGADLRYCGAWDAWLVYDGRRFRRDDSQEVLRRARDTVRAMYLEALDEKDGDRRHRRILHAIRSESAGRIEAMIRLARGDARVGVRPEQLDVDPYLLNVNNGTLDLRTAEIRPHRHEDLITKLAPVDWDPAARAELWDEFLRQAFGGDDELLAFVARAFGYALTGDTREECLFELIGPAASGKTTILETAKRTWGDYGSTTDFGTFLVRREDGPRADVARLVGKRMVAAAEVEKNKHLDEGLLKSITGGDTIAARELYQSAFEFRFTAKIFLAANDRPRVRDDDDAIWRRIIPIPFDHPVPAEKRDPRIKITLTDVALSGAAVLAWAVRGCMAWQREGLRVPAAVRHATDVYRHEMDPIGAFLDESCSMEESAYVAFDDLFRAYQIWAKATGERWTIGARDFGNRLTRHGFASDKAAKGVRVRRGLRLSEQGTLELADPETAKGEQNEEVPF